MYSETSVDFGACLIFCLLHSLEQRHSSTAVGLSISVTHDMLVAYSTHSFNTTRIALKFIVGFKGYSLLYFLVWSITTSFCLRIRKMLYHGYQEGHSLCRNQTWNCVLTLRSLIT